MIRKILSSTFASILLAAFISPALMADDAFDETSGAEEDPVNQLLSCTMKLVQNRKGSEQELQQLAYMVQAAITEEVNESSVETYVHQCRNLKESLADAPKNPKKGYLEWIDALPNSKGTKKLLTGFVKPHHHCYTVGVRSGLSFLGYGVIGTSTGLDMAMCHGSLGHKWFEVRPFGELTTGIGGGFHWGLHMGEEDGTTSQPSCKSFDPHLRVSSDLAPFVGFHYNMAVNATTENAYQYGLTFSQYPAMIFGGGGGANIRFGLVSEAYTHLKKVVLEPSITSTL
ncbi:hypothetical protein [Sansalvadorimonas verongulae]|uniref:hypothetical protein n=1 Tax=Sansalvadorimonas verongulae TaxID=2172824 RepID=UPI0012BBC6D6|nr:hypothetical protein [Sansalvadorimonas verongulae]MTI12476.1 hypothetical protein [Sansalvadorimonas verongulae]